MKVPDLWGTTDLRMLQLVVELHVRNVGDFPLDQLMDRVGLLDRGDPPSSFGPWSVPAPTFRFALRELIPYDHLCFIA
jgi:hypothetical protein